MLLSSAGGAFGILAGILLASGISALWSWPTEVAPATALSAFAFAALVGIFFGWYPARRAAGIDSIDALRYE